MHSHTKLITLSDIEVRYDAHRAPALSDLNLEINRGDFLAISGPNGGGKTTLLRVLLGLLRPTHGKVTYYDKDGKPVSRLHIGYLPQKSAIDTNFPITVREVILSGLLHSLTGKVGKAQIERLDEVVALTGTESFLHQSIGELSGGQLQRTLLARAIISKPEVLVLDEPLSYVDKRFEMQIYGIVQELARHTTIILVSHEMSVISDMATRHVIVDHTLSTCHSLHHYMPSCSDHQHDTPHGT